MNEPRTIKQNLDSCITQQDVQDVINTMDIPDMEEYLDAVEPARKFVELTMRDESILSDIRRHYDKIVGNIKDPIK